MDRQTWDVDVRGRADPDRGGRVGDPPDRDSTALSPCRRGLETGVSGLGAGFHPSGVLAGESEWVGMAELGGCA
jgi:hypothetical protein